MLLNAVRRSWGKKCGRKVWHNVSSQSHFIGWTWKPGWQPLLRRFEIGRLSSSSFFFQLASFFTAPYWLNGAVIKHAGNRNNFHAFIVKGMLFVFFNEIKLIIFKIIMIFNYYQPYLLYILSEASFLKWYSDFFCYTSYSYNSCYIRSNIKQLYLAHAERYHIKICETRNNHSQKRYFHMLFCYHYNVVVLLLL